MEIPNISLAFLIEELRPRLLEARIVKVQELPNNWLKITLFKKPENMQLIVANSAVFLTSHSLAAKHETSGFGAFLRKHLSGKKIMKVSQHGFDRVIELQIDGHFLIIELFAKGNVILTDSEKKILSSFRQESWKDREIRRQALYKFPASKEHSPESINTEQLFKFFLESREDAIRAFIQKVNIAPIIAEEVFFLAGIKKEKPAKEITQKEMQLLSEAAKKIYSLKQASSPGIFENEALLPFSLKSRNAMQTVSSINDFLDEHFSQQFLSPKEQVPAEKQRKIAALKKSLEKQLEQVEKFEKDSANNRQKGEAIFSNYEKISELIEQTKKGIMYKEGFLVKKLDRKSKKIVVEL